MDQLLEKLQKQFPTIQFVAATSCCWSSSTRTITFVMSDNPTDKWGLLHELGHALLGHSSYQTDTELLRKEVLAWDKARELGKRYRIEIQEGHVQECLDTYRDWVNKRSQCPSCGVKTIPTSNNTYSCFNCQTSWMVSPARHQRPYRKNAKIAR